MRADPSIHDDLVRLGSFCGRPGGPRMSVSDIEALYDALVAMGRVKGAIADPQQLADALADAQRRADCLYSCRVRRDRRMVAA